MADIDVSCVLDSSVGTLELNDKAAGYELDDKTRGELAVQWRKVKVENRWVEGSHLVSAVRGNVVEALGVYVRGSDSSEMKDRLRPLIAGISQPSYTITLTVDGVEEVWTCEVSDYSIQSPKELTHAKMALVKIQVERLPTRTVTLASAVTYEE